VNGGCERTKHSENAACVCLCRAESEEAELMARGLHDMCKDTHHTHKI
jgi:hypothetical protein